MPRQEIRFAVANEEFRGETWKVWCQGDELYLAFRGMVPVKVSFHGDGRCHVRLDRETMKRLAPHDSRFRKNPELQRWQIDRRTNQQTLFRVIVPYGAVSIERSTNDRADIVYVPPPVLGDASEVSLVAGTPANEPSIQSIDSRKPHGHVGTLYLEGGDHVSVIFHQRKFHAPPDSSGRPEMILGERDGVLTPGARCIYFVGPPDGPGFIEAVVGKVRTS
jgi:hypothetical protein